jgi:hypothetical protein
VNLRRALPRLGLLAVLAAGCSSHTSGSDAGGKDAGFDAGPMEVDSGPVDAGPMCPFAVHQPQGLPCNRDADCTTGRCYAQLSGGGYCTTPCAAGSSGTCATGYECVSAADRGDNVCALTSGTPPPSHAPLAFGSPCNADTDCAGAGAVCDSVLSADGNPYSFCTSFCDKTQSGVCGECGTCADAPQGGSAECRPKGNGALGDQCDQNSDCGTFYCRGFCTILCSSGTGDVIECPEGTVCRSLTSDGQTFGLCLSPAQIGGTQTGGPCTFDLECASGDTCHITPGAEHGTCQPGTGLGANCAMDSDCASGLVCRPIAPGLRHVGQVPENDALACTHDCTTPCGSSATCVALDLDTNLKLFQSQGGNPVQLTLPGSAADTNPTFGNRFSSFTQALSAGTYWVEVKAYHGAFGAYELEVTNGGAEGQTAEAAGDNGTPATAQTITVPTKISGTFSGPGDLDDYTFTLAADTTVTVRTSRGPASACLPTSMTAQVQ